VFGQRLRGFSLDEQAHLQRRLCHLWFAGDLLLTVSVGILIVVLSGVVASASARPPVQVWLAPDNDTPDLLDLFRRPDLWNRARSQISVLKLGPQQLGGGNPKKINTLADLTRVDAFRLLRTWGIKLALEVPTDCSEETMVRRVHNLVGSAHAAGGEVESVSMAGLLVSAVRGCKDNYADATTKSATFMRELRASAPTLVVGDIESYPAQRPAQIEQWLLALIKLGAAPQYLHLDANIHLLDAHPEIDAAADLRALRDFLRAHDIQFGIIFWSGYNPEPSDQAFFDHAMNWVRRVHAAIGAPDQAVFQSWVLRSSAGCSDTDPNCKQASPGCPPVGTPSCGLKTVPVNLPEDGPNVFSLTRLVNEAVGTLRQ
jgi:hypothetical protein